MAMKKDFGAYEIHEKIGSGGMASVYLGVQKSLDRKVVLKVLYPHLAEDEKLVVRFEREARAAAMLRHENIVQVIDCGRYEDVSYIAMEFVEGLDLKKWIEQFGTPPLEIALLLLRDLCGGLEHAHLNRIVHRDIKPANIMLTPEGILKIMDFGLARRGEDSTAVTVVGSVLGTPAYMSPEQATGEVVDERSDIFSSGVVGYELLGGQRPFQGDSYSTVLRAVLTVEPPSLASFNPLVPDEVVAIIHRMLQKDVSKRYPRIGLVRTDLDNALEQMGIHRSRDLLREYAQDPAAMGEKLKKKRLSRHLDQGLYFENMGLGKIDDALLEFRRVLHLDPTNATAHEHVKKLERERAEHPHAAVQAESDPDKTTVMSPEEIARLAAAPPPPRPTAAPAGPARPAAAAKPVAPAARPAPARAAAAPGKPAAGAGDAAKMRTMLLAAAGALVVVVAVVVGVIVFGGKKQEAAPTGETTKPVEQAEQTTPPVRVPDTGGPGSTGGQTATGSGTIGVTFDPAGAKVFLDGQPQKIAGGRIESVPAGSHTVRAEKAGYVAQDRQIQVADGQTAEVSFKLEASPDAMATLVIQAKPWATYYVDDQPAGTPNSMSARVQVKPGVHNVRAVNPNFDSKMWNNVRIEPNATRTLEWNFVAASTGRIKVPSPGTWAYVVINGTNTGKTTPYESADLKPGRYMVTLQKDGFVVDGGPQTVTVTGGETTVVQFKLKPATP